MLSKAEKHLVEVGIVARIVTGQDIDFDVVLEVKCNRWREFLESSRVIYYTCGDIDELGEAMIKIGIVDVNVHVYAVLH